MSRSFEARVLLVLSLAAGAFDALIYLGLERVFPANMTGNTVLLTVALARGSGTEAIRSATALAGFALGAGLGTLLMPTGHRRWPARARKPLLLELALMFGVFLWWRIGNPWAGKYGLIVLASGAMGAQSAAVHASDIHGVATTYMTGTYLNAIVRAANRLRGRSSGAPRQNLPGAAWIVYALGALAGGLSQSAWGAYAVLIPFGLATAVAGAAVARRQERGASRSSRRLTVGG